MRLLVVDESADACKRISDLLESAVAGCEIVVAGDPRAYQQALAAEPVDVVLTEYALSWTDGLVVLRDVQDHWPGVPTIMVTAPGNERVVIRGFRAGLQDYITKDQLDELLPAVRASLGLQRDGEDQATDWVLTHRTLHAVLEALPVGVVLSDPTGGFAFVNHAAQAVTGGQVTGNAHSPAGGYTIHWPDGSPIPPDELPLPRALATGEPVRNVELIEVGDIIGKTDADLLPAPEAETLTEIKNRVIGTGEGVTAELQLSPGGVTRWYEVFYQPFRDTNGNIVGLVSSSIEITERKEAEEALRKSRESAYHQLMEIDLIYRTAPVGLCVFDEDLRFVRINDRLAEINGLPVADHLGKTPREVVPDLADTAEALHQQIFETGEPVLSVEFEGTTPAEPERVQTWLEHWFPLKDGTGRVVAVSVVAEEITERKQAEQALRESEALYRAIAQNFPDGAIYVFDHDLRFRVADGEAMATLGYTREALEGRTIWEATGEDTWRILEQRYARVLAGESLHFETALRGRVFSSSYVPIKDDTGSIIAGMVVSHDITERKRTEEALQRYAEELEILNAQNCALLREVNHRVKNNLMAILSLIMKERIRLDRELPDDSRKARSLEALDDLSERVRSLATAHRLLSESEWRPLDVVDLVRQVIEASVSATGNANEQLTVEIGGDGVCIGPEHAHNLALVIGELTTNTMKYGSVGNGLRIAVEVALEDGEVRLRYRDNGPGYPASVLAGEGRSVGLELVHTVVTHSLRGSWRMHNERGAAVELRFPSGLTLNREAAYG